MDCKEVKSMLLQFRFKNYKSFPDEITIDLMATNIKEHQNTLLEVNGIKVLPVAAVFGANASGKSNLFLAFNSMKTTVLYSNNQNKLISVVPYIFNINLIELPTEYEVSINIGDLEYRYGFECNKDEIISEWLFKKPFVKNTRAKEKLVFYREKDTVEFGKLTENELEELEYAHNMALKSQLFLNIVGNRNKVQLADIYNWFNNSYSFNMADSHTENMLNDVNVEYLYHNKIIKDSTEELIKTIDPDILGLKIESYKDENLNEKFKCYSVHRVDNGQTVSIPFDIESSGTKKILSIAVGMFLTLRNGSTFFVDELDAKLHPLLLRYIVQLFTNKKINIANSQIVFSAHNIVCLDSSDLRRDEIWFVEKNNQKSQLFSLYDFKLDNNSIRSDLSFGKHYLAGRFGAVPFQKE